MREAPIANESESPRNVSYRVDQEIGHLILERGTLSLGGIREMARMISAAECRALIVSSAGTDFCRGRAAGGPRPTTAEQARTEVIDPILDLYRALGQAPFPVITAVSGCAHGLGFALAMSGDIVFADPQTSFALPEIKAGFPPLLALSQLIGVIPPKTLAHLALSAQTMSAQTLAEAGPINFLAPAAELPQLAQSYADNLATAPETTREITSFVRRSWLPQRSIAFDHARRLLGEVLVQPK